MFTTFFALWFIIAWVSFFWVFLVFCLHFLLKSTCQRNASFFHMEKLQNCVIKIEKLQLPEMMAIRKHTEQKLPKMRPQDWFSPLWSEGPQLLHWYPWQHLSFPRRRVGGGEHHSEASAWPAAFSPAGQRQRCSVAGAINCQGKEGGKHQGKAL